MRGTPLESSNARNDTGVTLVNKCDMGSQYNAAAKRLMWFLDCINRTIASQSKEMFSPCL